MALRHRVVHVQKGISTSWVLVGGGAASIVVVGGVIGVVRKWNKHLQAKIMVMLFTEVALATTATTITARGVTRVTRLPHASQKHAQTYLSSASSALGIAETELNSIIY